MFITAGLVGHQADSQDAGFLVCAAALHSKFYSALSRIGSFRVPFVALVGVC